MPGVLAAVHHAEVVAHRVGEPFGTLVLLNTTTSVAGPIYSSSQLALIAVASLVLYGAFVVVRTVRHRDYFLPEGGATGDAEAHAAPPSKRGATLAALLLPACLGVGVLLAKALAPTIERGVDAAGGADLAGRPGAARCPVLTKEAPVRSGFKAQNSARQRLLGQRERLSGAELITERGQRSNGRGASTSGAGTKAPADGVAAERMPPYGDAVCVVVSPATVHLPQARALPRGSGAWTARHGGRAAAPTS